MTAKKGYIAIIVLCALLISLTPVGATDDSNVITLSQAKELARTKARSMQNLAATQDKLEVDAIIAYADYFGTDIQNNIDGYRARIRQLESQIDNLDPVEDADEISDLQKKISDIEKTVSGLKAKLPSTEDYSNAYRLVWRAKDYAYTDMDKMISDAEKVMDSKVENMYFGLLTGQNTIMVQEKNLDLLGTQLRIERLKKTLGLSTDIDEKNVVLQYDTLNKMLADLKKAQKITIWQFNDLLGREVNSELSLVAERITPEPTKVNYEDVLGKVIENSLSIAQKKREIEDYVADAYKEDDSYERSSLQSGEVIAKLELEDLIENANVTVKSLVDGLETSYKNWENKNLAKINAEETYLNDKLKYEELGMISKLQYMGSEIAYLQALNDESTAAQDWYTAKQKIQMANDGIF